jgi:hypothetical protein
MPRHGLEQLERACHRERQDDPVRLRQGQCALGGRGGRALVTEFAVRERCQQVCLNDCHVADSRSYPVQGIADRGESGGRVALGEADSRARIADLGGACQIRIECCQRGPGLAELPESRLGGQPPARQLTRQRM